MLSHQHVCVAHNGKLIDTWNSCGIRIENVCVPNELVNTISTILDINGIMVEKLGNLSIQSAVGEVDIIVKVVNFE